MSAFYEIDVDVLFGWLISLPPITTVQALKALQRPSDGSYYCYLTRQWLPETEVVLVNGRLIMSIEAIQSLRQSAPEYQVFFTYLLLVNARMVLRKFERLDSNDYRTVLESVQSRATKCSRSVAFARAFFLSELLIYHILVEDVSVLMEYSAEEVSLQDNPFAGMATRCSTRESVSTSLNRVYQEMCALMQRARSGNITTDEKKVYADLRLEAIALELIMYDHEHNKQ